jgi:hypothetical protein
MNYNLICIFICTPICANLSILVKSGCYNYIHRLHDLNSVAIPRFGFPFSKFFFSKFSFQITKIRGSSELSDLQGNFGENPINFGVNVWPAGYTS